MIVAALFRHDKTDTLTATTLVQQLAPGMWVGKVTISRKKRVVSFLIG